MKIACVFVLAAVGCTAAYADQLVTARPTGTDSVSWFQLDTNGILVPQSFTFTTAGGASGSGSLAGGGGEVFAQTTQFAGNFFPYDGLVYTAGHAPLTLTFGSGYTQIGAQIQGAGSAYGVFTAQICDTNGCFTEAGDSTSANDGSAIYIGISSSTPINSVTFSVISSADNVLGNFAIDQVTLDAPAVAPVPEPSSLALLGTGLVSAMCLARRRFVRS